MEKYYGEWIEKDGSLEIVYNEDIIFHECVVDDLNTIIDTCVESASQLPEGQTLYLGTFDENHELIECIRMIYNKDGVTHMFDGQHKRLWA